MYGGYFHETLYYGDEVDQHLIIIYGEFDYDNYEAYEVIPETVGQYTGLRDDKRTKEYPEGQMIFEGDVVKHYCSTVDKTVFDIGKIYWDENICQFRRTSRIEGQVYDIDNSCSYEVIGNVHDNPELLKGGVE